MKVHFIFPINRLTARIIVLASILMIGLSACTGLQSYAPAPAAQQAVATGSPTSNSIPNTGAMPTATGMAMPGSQTTSGSTPNAVSKSAGPKAYIGLFKDNAIAVLDTGTNQVIKTIPIPTGPHGLVISADGRWVYASSDGDSKVSVIDTTSDTLVKSIEVGKAPHGLAMTPDGRLVLAAVFGTSQVAFIDTSSSQVVGQVEVPSPHNIAISPDGHTAYVAAQKKGSTGLAVIDIDKKAQITFIPLDKTPRALNFSPDGKQLYFTEAGVDAVQVLDPATNQISAQVDTVGSSPHHVLFAPDGGLALVVSQGTSEVYFIAPQTNVSFLSLPVGKMPHWITMNAQATTAWVTNEVSNTVTVIDLKKFSVTATIPVGNAPRKMVVQPGQPAAGETPQGGQAANTVMINQMAFGPNTITIKAGQAVTWVNQDTINHTTTGDQGNWDSGPLAPGQSYQMVFTNPGQYSYHCSIHPFMTGKVIVTQ